MDVIFTHGAGLDEHTKSVMAYQMTPDPTGQQPEGLAETKELSTLRMDLLAMSDWLAERRPRVLPACREPGRPPLCGWRAPAGPWSAASKRPRGTLAWMTMRCGGGRAGIAIAPTPGGLWSC